MTFDRALAAAAANAGGGGEGRGERRAAQWMNMPPLTWKTAPVM